MRRVLPLLCLLLPVGASAQPPAAVSVQMPLSLTEFKGCEMQGAVVRLPRLYRQAAVGAALWMEAEEYSRARYRPVLERDERASGGRYAARIVRADYRFTLQSAGTYQVWERALFPFAASWGHTENMDTVLLQGLNLADCANVPADAGKVNQYTWIKAGRYELAAGEHTFSLNYHGGAQLDKLLITPDLNYVPTGAGEPARAEGLAEGTATSADLQPAAVVAWEQLKWRADPKGGTLAAEWSADSGKTWQALPADLSLAAVPAAGQGQDRLRLRFTLRPGPQGESPTLLDPQVVYRSARQLPQAQPLPPAWRDTSGKLPLVLSRATGCAWEATSARTVTAVATPDSTGGLWWEAEAAEGGSFSASTAPALASGGEGAERWLYFPPRSRFTLRYRFYLPEERKLTLWLRCRLADREYFRHAESFDGEKLQALGPPPSAGAEWQWYPGLTRTLAAGHHVLTLLHSSRGFDWSSLDRLALSPSAETAPPAPGQPGGLAVPATGLAEAFPVTAPPGARYLKLSWKGLGVAAEASADGGKAWREVPDGDLSWVPAEQAAPLLVRFRLQGTTASLAAPEITYTAPTEPFARLSGAGYNLYLLPRAAAVCGLYDRLAQRWVIPLGSREQFLRFDWCPPGAFGVYTAAGESGVLFLQEASATGLKLGYSFMDDALRATCSFGTGTGELSPWDITFENRSALEVRRVQFPSLASLRLSSGGEGDTLMWPFPFGWRIANPSRDSFAKLTYPGNACMAWTDLHDAAGGVYLALADHDLIGTDFSYTGDPATGSIALSLAAQRYLGPGESWTGHYRVGVHPGDWHWGADRYRAWLATWLQPPRHPEWMRQCDGIFMPGIYSDMWPARYDEGALRTQLFGLNYDQMWGMTGEAEPCGLLPYLNPRLGTPAQFAAGHQAAREQGVHFTYYMNCQGWVSNFASLDRLGFIPRRFFPADLNLESTEFYLQNTVYGLDGEPISDGPGVNWTTSDRVMCCGSTGWREHLRSWMVDQYAKVFRTDGTYLDQTGCATPQQCWRDDHGHGKQHMYWGKGLVEHLERVIREARRTNPDYIVGIEGASDVMGQYAGYHLWNGEPDVFLYVCPWALPMVGCMHFDSRKVPAWLDTVHHIWLNSRLWAGRFEDWFYDQAKYENARTMNSALRDMVMLRHATKEWQYNAAYQSTAGLTIPDARVEGCWFLRSDGGRLGAVVNLHNEGGVPGVRVSLARPDLQGARAVAYTLSGARAITLEKTREGVAFVAPAAADGSAAISSVLLVKQVPAAQGLQLSALQPWDGGPSRLAATLVNWTGKPISGTLSLEAAPEQKLAALARPVTVPAGQPLTVDLIPPGLDALPRPGWVTLRFAAGGLAAGCRVMAWPVLWNGGFEDDRNDDSYPDAWGTVDWSVYHVFIRMVHDVPIEGLFGTRDGGAASGRWCLRLDPPVPYSYDFLVGDLAKPHFHDQIKDGKFIRRAFQDAVLRPGHTYRFSAAIKRGGTDGEVYAEMARQRLAPAAADPVGEWKRYETTLTAGAAERGLCLIALYNSGSAPAWFDDVRVEEVPAP